MKYFLIVGEASGDLHASNLMKEIQKLDKTAEFQYLGGDLMHKIIQKPPLIHYKAMAFMGVFDVLKNIFKIYKNLQKTKKAINTFNPDAVILIDYPGFNFKIAKFAHQKGYPTHYYIAPKIWAWKEGRIKQIKKYIDKLYIILPFEKEFYKKHNYPAIYVGNPVMDAVRSHQYLSKDEFYKKNNLPDKPIISLLPGSRKNELKGTLNKMLKITENFPEYQFVVSGAPGFTMDDYKDFLQGKNLPVVFGQTYDLLKHAQAAVVTSGTATLETALIKTPQVVVYQVGNLQYKLFRNFVKIKFFSLVNLILDKEAVTELLQDSFNPRRLTEELKAITTGNKREKMLQDYDELEQILGKESASEKTAGLIYENLSKLK